MERKNNKIQVSIGKSPLPEFYIHKKTGVKEDAEKSRKRSRDYQKSDSGKMKVQEYKEKNLQRIRKYNRDYFANRRREAAALGLCATCLKVKEANGTLFCDKCRDRMRVNAQMQRRRKYTVTGKEQVARDLWEDIKANRYTSK
jgi:hypothetical protein